jgi:hypothetical protein
MFNNYKKNIIIQKLDNENKLIEMINKENPNIKKAENNSSKEKTDIENQLSEM